MRTNISTSATLPLHYISYLVLYRAFVAFPLIQKIILNQDTTQKLIVFQQDFNSNDIFFVKIPKTFYFSINTFSIFVLAYKISKPFDMMEWKSIF